MLPYTILFAQNQPHRSDHTGQANDPAYGDLTAMSPTITCRKTKHVGFEETMGN